MGKDQLSYIRKNKMLMFVLATILLFSAAFAGALILFYRTDSPVSLVPDDAQLVALGERLYKTDCASCHGNNLEGQPNWKKRNPDGLMPAPPHDETGHTWHHADTVLFKLTKFGPAKLIGADYKSDMPAFKETLSDHEIIAVLSYIKSTWPIKIIKSHAEINRAYNQRNTKQ